MCNTCSCSSRHQSCQTSIPKQIEDIYGSGYRLDQFAHPIPVRSTLWKYTQMTSRSGLSPESKFVIIHHPTFRNRVRKIPMPSALFPTRLEYCISSQPAFGCKPFFPDCLDFRSDKHKFPESFHLLPIPTI